MQAALAQQYLEIRQEEELFSGEATCQEHHIADTTALLYRHCGQRSPRFMLRKAQ